MKPTIKASISGIAFNLEEDAYRLLQKYLDRLQRHYAKIDGGKEIVDDIELRIAELLSERVGSPEQVVSTAMIQEIIKLLGQPEEIDNDAAAEEIPADNDKDTVRKRLYRDIDHKVLGGVCSGIATYFNIDVVIIRVLFVVFFIGFSILGVHFFTSGSVVLLYILMWIIIPPARTVKQRFEMHGEAPTVKNIQRKVEEELSAVGNSLKKAKPVAGEIVNGVGRVLAVIIGSCLVLFAVGFLIAFVVALVSGHAFTSEFFTVVKDYVAVNFHPWWFFGLLSALLFLPLLAILYAGISLLFRIKTKIKIGLIIFLLWIATLLTFIGISTFSAKSFFFWRTVHEYVELPEVKSDTLYIDIPEKYYTEGSFESAIARMREIEEYHYRENGKIVRKTGRINIFGCTARTWETTSEDFDDLGYSDERALLLFFQEQGSREEQLCLLPVVYTDYSRSATNFSIDVRKSAAGKNSRTAYNHAKDIDFNYQLNDSLLVVDPLVYTKDGKWEGEFLHLRIRIPEGKKIIFGKAFREHEVELIDWD